MIYVLESHRHSNARIAWTSKVWTSPDRHPVIMKFKKALKKTRANFVKFNGIHELEADEDYQDFEYNDRDDIFVADDFASSTGIYSKYQIFEEGCRIESYKTYRDRGVAEQRYWIDFFRHEHAMGFLRIFDNAADAKKWVNEGISIFIGWDELRDKLLTDHGDPCDPNIEYPIEKPLVDFGEPFNSYDSGHLYFEKHE